MQDRFDLKATQATTQPPQRTADQDHVVDNIRKRDCRHTEAQHNAKQQNRAGLADGRIQAIAAIGLHVEQGREALLHQHDHAVERQRERQVDKVLGHQRHSGFIELASTVDHVERTCEDNQVQCERNQEEQHLGDATRNARAYAVVILLLCVVRELGIERRRKRGGNQRVGQRVPQARIGDDGRTSLGLDHQRGSVGDRSRDKHAHRGEQRRDTERNRLAQRGVLKVDMDMGMHAVLAKRGNLTCHLNKDTEGRTGRNQDDAGTFAKLCGHGRKTHKARNDDHIVEDRGKRRPEVVAVCVENAREHRAQTIKQNLDGKETEHERSGIHAAAVTRKERLRPDKARGEHGPQQRNATQHQKQNAEQVAHVLVRGLATLLTPHAHVHGQKRRHEHAAHHEFVEHIGQVVGDLIGGRK